MVKSSVLFAAPAVIVAGVLFASLANAAGCNGVVDQLKWGCAAWDNNNGPQYPHYKKPQTQHAPARVAPAAPSAQAPRPTIAPNAGNRLIGNDGAGIVAAGGGNAVNKSGIVAAGGGNAVNKSGSGIVAAGGGNAVQK